MNSSSLGVRRPIRISATRQTYVAVYKLGLGLGLVLGLFSALLGPRHLCLTGCRNSAPSQSNNKGRSQHQHLRMTPQRRRCNGIHHWNI